MPVVALGRISKRRMLKYRDKDHSDLKNKHCFWSDFQIAGVLVTSEARTPLKDGFNPDDSWLRRYLTLNSLSLPKVGQIILAFFFNNNSIALEDFQRVPSLVLNSEMAKARSTTGLSSQITQTLT